MLKVLQSNRLEILASHLGRDLREPGAGQAQLAGETVVVPNPGVARWLWLHLARQHGISANLDCLLPGSFVWGLFHRLLADVPERSPYEPAVMAWRLHRLLREAIGNPAYSGLLDWRDTKDDRRRFELAQSLASLFDQYIVYRPEWIEKWRKDDNVRADWQQKLWCQLTDETAEPDWTGLRRQLNGLSADEVRSRLPPRVSVFGIPLLSPGYLEVLTWLGGHIDVNLFLPNPCMEYWGHIVAERDIGRLAGVADEKTLYIETGNALLASWGAQGRDLLDLVQEIGPDAEESDYSAPGDQTLLHAVQTHILELRNPGTEDQPAEPVQPDDRSIQVHVCHSPTRELEVLHDQLLAMFDDADALTASDVIVMTPDIEAYAPYIDAVFGTAKRIPFRIADVNTHQGEALIETFMSLFDLVRERFDANQVLGILDVPSVRRRFGLAETDMRKIRDWIRETGVRWGLDAAGRAEFGRDDNGLHSWQHGLDRLMLGFALPGEQTGTFSGVLPHDNIEGSEGLVLGSLAEFVARLKEMMSALAAPRTAAEWSDCLHTQLESFFDVREDQENEAQLLRDAINSLRQYSSLAKNSEVIGYELATDWVAGQLETSSTTRGFLGHGITFCGIVPMRSVPTSVVCLIGLNDGVFPRIERPPAYDLIAREPKRGDRSRREDDRQAFLECLLNAREVFYLSYIGRGIRDDTPIPPSVLVSEVIDYCNRSFVGTDEQAVGDSLVTRHRVQAFSQRYFDGSDPRLFSYTDIIARPLDEPKQPGNFLGSLSEPDAGLLNVSLEDLIRFFKNPTRALLKNRLNISYEGESEPINTDDPVVLGSLDNWSVGELMLQLLETGHSPGRVLDIVRNTQYSPIGRVADVTLTTMMGQIEQIHRALLNFRPADEPVTVDFSVRQAGVTLTGRLDQLYESGQYRWRHGKTRAHVRMDLWIRHLLLNIEKPKGVALSSHWRADDITLRIDPIADADVLLQNLLSMYRRGMQEPLPFFPGSAWVYVEALGETGDRSAALAEAKKNYSNSSPGFCEEMDPYVSRVFRYGVDWDLFQDLAIEVFEPLAGRTIA